jgi:hypothetical protein
MDEKPTEAIVAAILATGGSHPGGNIDTIKRYRQFLRMLRADGVYADETTEKAVIRANRAQQ